jgi:hypothetical protein
MDTTDIAAKEDSSLAAARAEEQDGSSSAALAHAFKPVVEKAMYESIKNNPHTFANILYPVIRPAIQKSIASAFKNMLQSFNNIIESSLSFKGVRWRFEALITRKPFAEVVLLHNLLFAVSQVFLIHKESGLLLHQVQSGLSFSPEGDLVSAMLNAIREFVRDSFNVREDSLETIQVGDFSIWIEQGEFVFLAVVIRGNAPESLRSLVRHTLQKIEHEFRTEFERFQDETAPFEKTGLLMGSCLQTEVKPQKKRVPLVSWLLLLAVIGLTGYWVFSSWQSRQKWSTYVKQVESIPGVIITGTGKKDGKFVINGLRDPLSLNPVDLLNQSQLDPGQVSSHWNFYHSLEPQYILQRAIKILNPPAAVHLEFKDGVLYAGGTASHRWIQESLVLARGMPGIEKIHRQELTDLELQEFHTLVKEIEAWQFHFVSATDRLEPGQEALLDNAAGDLLKALSLTKTLKREIKIIINGHTDPSGGEELNRKISTSRGERIFQLLVSRKIPAHVLSYRGLAGTNHLRERVVSFTVEVNKTRGP